MTTTCADAPLRALFDTLAARRRPEDVAEMVGEVLGSALTPADVRLLDGARRGSLKRSVYGYSSMAQAFAGPVGMGPQVQTACELFAEAHPLTADLYANPNAIEAFVHELSRMIGKEPGKNDFMYERLPSKTRKARGIELSRRAYNKRFRLLARMEERLSALVRAVQRVDIVYLSKSGLASKVTWEAFAADVDTACFVAYFTATSNRRSEFTVDPQVRPFDTIAEMLFARCLASSTANWRAIAHVFPHADVLSRLDAESAGALLGTWYGVLGELSDVLEEAWVGLSQHGGLDRTDMVVRRGMDSSTWNETAGAWNKARDHWMGLVYALGMERVLDASCPGKVMRLMAADVAAWHSFSRSGIDPNTLVWADLPMPWEVLQGRVRCGRAEVEAVCARHGVDAERGGWTAPRARTRVAEFTATPELVHGVSIGSPRLATMLRKAGWFAGPSKHQTAAMVK